MTNILMALGLVVAAIFWAMAEFLKFLFPAHLIADFSTWGFASVLCAFVLSLICWGLGIGND
jgi:hypothetical protein